jgi:hypothetical protein
MLVMYKRTIETGPAKVTVLGRARAGLRDVEQLGADRADEERYRGENPN